MLATMKALTQSARAICYTAGAIDRVAPRRRSGGAQAPAMRTRRPADPGRQGLSTDIGNEVASLGVQVHGGMGFIEETGAAQYMRDARIAAIYEGTNGIQAIDLAMRKLPPAIRFIKALVANQKPLVACVDGVAVGVGTTMLFHCDLVVRRRRARMFHMPFVDLGLVPEAGSSMTCCRAASDR
jgi:hypothetical protein